MEMPRTTRQALELTIDGWAALEGEFAGLREADLPRSGTVGDWSPRDLLAHLDASNRWIAGPLDALRRGELPDPAACVPIDQPPPAEIDLANDDDRNDWYQTIRRDWPLARVREECAWRHYAGHLEDLRRAAG